MKSLLRNLLRKSGYDIFKHDARYHEVFCRCHLLERNPGAVVLDVGANKGQFGSELRDYKFGGKIISFEPLQDAHAALENTSRHDSSWTVAERSAIGSEPGEAEINVSANSVSSSLLPLEQVHVDIAPESAYIGKQKIEVKRLDDAVEPHSKSTDQFYLKVDTQGFEKHVLEGAPDVVSRSQAVELELSLAPTYSGCLVFSEGLKLMEDAGFKLFSTYEVLKDRRTGELLQLNAFFIRS